MQTGLSFWWLDIVVFTDGDTKVLGYSQIDISYVMLYRFYKI